MVFCRVAERRNWSTYVPMSWVQACLGVSTATIKHRQKTSVIRAFSRSIGKAGRFSKHPLPLAICLLVLHMDITVHKGKHSHLFCFFLLIPRVYPNNFSFKSITWIVYYLFRQKKLANSLTSHITDISPHISPSAFSCFTPLSLNFAFCLLCHIEESIRNWWMVTDLQACLPAFPRAWNSHDAAFLPCVCASCFPLICLFCYSWQISTLFGHRVEGKESQRLFLSFLRKRRLRSRAALLLCQVKS